jgi:predicted nucleic acid-binding protein
MTKDLGWLDTNLFVHALYRGDPEYRKCAEIIGGLQDGSVTGWIDRLVVHELTYVLKRLPQFPSMSEVHGYVRNILLAEGIRADDKSALLEALARWAAQEVGFVDAWLAVQALRRNMPVCSVNNRHFPDVENMFL